MNYLFHPDAETEFYNAIDYYENCVEGLGYDFSIEVFTTINRIVTYPKAWAIIEDDIRRCPVNRFPFGVLYTEFSDKILILAIMHLHRNPDYWKKRIEHR